MSTVLAVQPTSTLDDFLLDPIVQAEFQVVIERLMSDSSVQFNGFTNAGDMRVKVRENGETKAGTREPRRTRWIAEDVARLIFIAWREHRP